jgi:hypothetical protein
MLTIRGRGFFLSYQVSRFVLLFAGRSGSTYIISKLNSHPYIYARGEQLVDYEEGEASDQLRWTRDFLSPPLIGRNQVLGFKTKLVDVLDPDGFAQILHDTQSRIIYLRRQNHVKAVVSRLNGMRLVDKTGRWNLFDKANRLSPFEIDPVEFNSMLEHRVRVDRELENYVQTLQLPTLSLLYEELILDESSLFGRIHSFLGVSPEKLEGRTFKNTPDDLSRIVINLDELRSNYVDTPYESMFDEVLDPVNSRK